MTLLTRDFLSAEIAERSNQVSVCASRIRNISWPSNTTFRLLPLTSINVVAGIYCEDVIRTSDDLMLGDRYEFGKDLFLEEEMHIADGVLLNSRLQPLQDAIIRRRIMLMSENANIVCGFIVGPNAYGAGDTFLGLPSEFKDDESYTLIINDSDAFDMIP